MLDEMHCSVDQLGPGKKKRQNYKLNSAKAHSKGHYILFCFEHPLIPGKILLLFLKQELTLTPNLCISEEAQNDYHELVHLEETFANIRTHFLIYYQNNNSSFVNPTSSSSAAHLNVLP